MTNMTGDEVLAAYIAEFGAEDGPIIANLTDRVANLALRWKIFLYFFCGPKERIDVLNKASGMTASLVQNLLWDDALLRVRQITDPAKRGQNNNLSLAHLVRIAAQIRKQDLSAAHKTTLETCGPARIFATKHLAHLDLAHATGGAQSEITRRQTTEAIRAICLFVQQFHAQVRDTTYALLPIMGADDEQQFLLRLHKGNQAEDAIAAASRAAAKSGDWGALRRTDIPDWIHEQRGPLDLF